VNAFDQLSKELPAFTSKTKRPASNDWGSRPVPVFVGWATMLQLNNSKLVGMKSN
jgi:hypothetical protein